MGNLTTLDGTGKIEWLEVPKGTLANLNGFGGLVPCRIEHLRRVTYRDGRVELWADCVFTATRGHYKKGVREARDLCQFVPRSAVHKSRQRPGFKVIWAFKWSDFIPALKES